MDMTTEYLPARTLNDTNDECDRCGTTVHRETAVEQGDGADIPAQPTLKRPSPEPVSP